MPGRFNAFPVGFRSLYDSASRAKTIAPDHVTTDQTTAVLTQRALRTSRVAPATDCSGRLQTALLSHRHGHAGGPASRRAHLTPAFRLGRPVGGVVVVEVVERDLWRRREPDLRGQRADLLWANASNCSRVGHTSVTRRPSPVAVTQ